jgi:hypothetical protein
VLIIFPEGIDLVYRNRHLTTDKTFAGAELIDQVQVFILKRFKDSYDSFPELLSDSSKLESFIQFTFIGSFIHRGLQSRKRKAPIRYLVGAFG